MKKVIVCILLAAAITVLCGIAFAEGASTPSFNQDFFTVKVNEEVQFSYIVPDDYQVESVSWFYTPYFTTGYGADFYCDGYGYTLTNDENGKCSLDAPGMIRVMAWFNKGLPTECEIFGYMLVTTPEDAFSYTVSGGNATITGADSSKLSHFVIIPETLGGYPVTAIGDHAFDMSNLGSRSTELYIPDSVTHIGKYAFASCTDLTTVRMSQRLTSMGEYAFGACLYLSSIMLPDSLKVIPDYAFINCWGLRSHYYPNRNVWGNEITSIGTGAFAGNINLFLNQEVPVPDTLTYIGERAFEGCIVLDHINIPSGVTRIEADTFKNCKALESVDLPASLTYIGDNAFYNCSKISELTLSASLEEIGTDAFYDCGSLSSLTLDESNPYFKTHEGALITADETRLIAYPALETNTSCHLPGTITQIERGAFRHTRYLRELVLPEDFNDYFPEMFYDATGLQSVSFHENSLTEIPDRFFYNCTSLVSPTDFTGITSVGVDAFINCSSLPSVSFDGALTHVGNQAFKHCTSLSQTVFPDTLTDFGVSAFSGCTSLQTFDMPAQMTTTSIAMFENCTALNTVTWSDHLESIQSRAFFGTALTSLSFPATLKSIEAYAFGDTVRLESITLPEALELLGTSAFSGSGLKTVTLPETGLSLGHAVFKDCMSLESVTLNAAATYIPYATFEGCRALTECPLTDNIQLIGERAFMNCTSLTSFILPNTLKTVNSKAFAGCENLSNVLIYPGVTAIAADAFSGCATNIVIRGWPGSAAWTLANENGFDFLAMDTGLIYDMNAAGDGLMITGGDPYAYQVTIPASSNGLPVVGLADKAFQNCRELAQITVDADSAYFSAENGLLLSKDGTRLIYCPINFSGNSLVIPQSVTAIGDYAFEDNRNLRSVNIGTSVVTFGSHIFDGANSELCLLVVPGSAAETYAINAGLPYRDSLPFTYRFEDGKAYITGYTGEDDSIVIPSVVYGYPVYAVERMEAPVRIVTVEAGVQVIGDNAFFPGNSASTLEAVYLPDTVIRIDGFAFRSQDKLRTIQLGSGLQDIGAWAFTGCSSLGAVVLPDSLRSIGYMAFSGSGLEELTIPREVLTIGKAFVSGCPNLRSISISAQNAHFTKIEHLLYANDTQTLLYCDPGVAGSVTVRDGTLTLADYVFAEQDQITQVLLPDSLIEICAGAFSNCASLTELVLPEHLELIGDSVFYYCTALERIEIPASVKNVYGSIIFSGCLSLKEMILNEGLEYLNMEAYTCYALTELHFPSTLKTFSGVLPANLKTLTTAPGSVRYVEREGIVYDMDDSSIFFVNDSVHGEITIMDGVLSVREKAFLNCTAITGVNLPESCTEIWNSAFENCTALTKVSFPKASVSIGIKAFANTGLTSLTLSNASYIGESAFMDCVKLESAVIGGPSQLRISGLLFHGCTALVSAELPEECTLGGGTFWGCSALKTVRLPQNMTAINGSDFRGCSSLETIELPASVTSIGYWSFYECSSLRSVVLHSQLTEIGENAFFNCAKLTSFDLQNTVTTIGAGAFGGTGLTEVTIPEGIETIGENTFYCPNLSRVSLPSTLKHIGANAFGNTQITSLTLPEGLLTIGERAFCNAPLLTISFPGSLEIVNGFEGCGSLQAAYISPGTKKVGANAFSGCLALREVTLPTSVEEIGAGAFSGCSELSGVKGEPNLKVIGAAAFAGCAKLQYLNAGKLITHIGDSAFARCRKLERLSSSASIMGLELPNVVSIGDSAFFVCQCIRKAELGDKLEYVGTAAFDACQIERFVFPDTVTYLGDNAIWRNQYVTYVRLPAGLTSIPKGMFSSVARLDSLIIPSGVKRIAYQAFYGVTSIIALNLPDGLERIEEEAFARSTFHLYIPASVNYIAENAFNDATVEIYTPLDSYAYQYAVAHHLPVYADQKINEKYLEVSGTVARQIVSEVVHSSMTDYQKSEALLDWMLANVVLNDNLNDSFGAKQSLIMRKASRWGWAYGYQALLTTAGLTNDMYFTGKGYVTSIDDGGFGVAYTDGEVVNMIGIDGQWYFTHPAFVQSNPVHSWLGKANYFMMTKDIYLRSFGVYPEVADCDGYEQSYLYQEYSSGIEQTVSTYADERFRDGDKLVYAPVDTTDVPHPDCVLNYAGQHMDTLDWTYNDTEFEPAIIGTDTGYWLSGDLTGEYADVGYNSLVVNYGESLAPEWQETASLYNCDVPGVVSISERAEPMAMLMTTDALIGSNGEADIPITQPTVFDAVFTPELSAYLDTLDATRFDLTVNCQLPAPNDTFLVENEAITVTLSPDHLFIEEGQLTFIFTQNELPEGVEPERLYYVVPDAEAYYTEGTRVIRLDGENPLPCGSYNVSVTRTAEGYVASTWRLIGGINTIHIEEMDEAVEPTCAEVGSTAGSHCSRCGAIMTGHEEIPMIDHLFGDWTVTIQSTPFMEGEEQRVCQHINHDVACTATEIRVLPCRLLLSANAAYLRPGEKVSVEANAEIALLEMVSSDPQIVACDGNVLTAVSLGTATVTATVNGFTATLTATVAESFAALRLPANMTIVQADAFYGSAVVHVVLPAGVSTVESGAFAQCAALRTVRVAGMDTAFDIGALAGSGQAVILCKKDSAAHDFAKGNRIAYLLIE